MLKTSKLIFKTIVLLFLGLGFFGCSNPVDNHPDYNPGELLIHLTEPLAPKVVVNLTESYGIELLEYFEYVAIVWVGVPEGQEMQWKEELEKDSLIRSASLVRNNVTPR
ncbi:MAG: hypothetical protein LAT67_08620 [Balneolales bacterium]|nr:hypothetical protein [Balneolales bacterium]